MKRATNKAAAEETQRQREAIQAKQAAWETQYQAEQEAQRLQRIADHEASVAKDAAEQEEFRKHPPPKHMNGWELEAQRLAERNAKQALELPAQLERDRQKTELAIKAAMDDILARNR
jgi:hypothetical protein